MKLVPSLEDQIAWAHAVVNRIRQDRGLPPYSFERNIEIDTAAVIRVIESDHYNAVHKHGRVGRRWRWRKNEDKRRRAIECLMQGMTIKETARITGLAGNTVWRMRGELYVVMPAMLRRKKRRGEGGSPDAQPEYAAQYRAAFARSDLDAGAGADRTNQATGACVGAGHQTEIQGAVA